MNSTPVVVHVGGGDAAQEELYHLYAAVGPSLGYAVLTFDGPGQGIMLKKHKTVLRSDFEAVFVKPLNYLGQLAAGDPELGLDMDRVAIVGASTGAYYALRAAIDPRIKACVSVDPPYGLWRVARKRMPTWYVDFWVSGWLLERLFNASVYLQMMLHFLTRWEVELGMAMTGASTPGNVLRRMQLFDLDVAPDDGGRIVDRIRCAVLLTGATRSLYSFADESTLAIYDALSQVPKECKEMWIPEEIGNGGLTAKVGAWALLAQKSFEFLDRHMHVIRGEGSSLPKSNGSEA